MALIDQHEREREFEMTMNARLMFAAFAASGAKKKGGGSFSIKDFLPQSIVAKWRKQKAPKSVHELAAQAKHLNTMITAIEEVKQKRKVKGSGNDR